MNDRFEEIWKGPSSSWYRILLGELVGNRTYFCGNGIVALSVANVEPCECACACVYSLLYADMGACMYLGIYECIDVHIFVDISEVFIVCGL